MVSCSEQLRRGGRHRAPLRCSTPPANTRIPLTKHPTRDAVHKLLDANVAGAPVVDEGGAIVGLLSESDLIWKVRGARIN